MKPQFSTTKSTSGQDVVASSQSTVSNATKSLTLTQLAKGATYEVAVYARSSGPYRSPPSNKIVIVTETSILDAPAQLAVVSSTATTVNVSWMAPLDAGGLPILRYEVRYGVMGAGEVLTKAVETSRLSYSIRRLGPARQYQITVWAVNARGKSKGATVIATTQSLTFNTIELTLRSVVRNGEREIDFVFETVQPDDVNVSQYRIYVDGFPYNFRAREENTQMFAVHGLKAGEAYVIQVTAVNSLGEEGERSDPIAVTTSEKSCGISSSILVGSVIGSALAGALIAFLVTYFVTKHRSNTNGKQKPKERLGMKDSRLYAESRGKGVPKPEPTYEDAEHTQVVVAKET